MRLCHIQNIFIHESILDDAFFMVNRQSKKLVIDYSTHYFFAKNNQYQEAIHVILNPDKCVLKYPFNKNGNHSWYCVGDIYFKLGYFDLALNAFKRSLKSDPADDWCMLAIGNCYDELQRPKMAERFFRKVIQIAHEKQTLETAFYNLGNALFDQEKFTEACYFYKKVMFKRTEWGAKARKNFRLSKNNEKSNSNNVE